MSDGGNKEIINPRSVETRDVIIERTHRMDNAEYDLSKMARFYLIDAPMSAAEQATDTTTTTEQPISPVGDLAQIREMVALEQSKTQFDQAA